MISPIYFLIGLFFVSKNSEGQLETIFKQKDSVSISRVVALGTGVGLGSAASLYIINKNWYSNYQRVPFHFFNDNKDWLFMDKAGHALSSYYGGYYGYNACKWAGVSEKKSILIGGMYGFSFLLITETMDGFSSTWGASTGDVIANGIGSTLFSVQQLLIKNQVFTPKFSYWPTQFAQYRPNVLGDNHWNRWLKDYNGQIYWLSFSLADLKVSESYFPKWLSLAVGYSGDGMLGGSENPQFNEQGVLLPEFDRNPEFFLSLDINFQNIQTKSKLLNTCIKGLSFIKIPFSSISLKGSKVSFNPLTY
tara:strand:+ start:3155 stop:4072 length:918 start_codon:yes stop_codon:yes gene_type:complete